MVIVIFLNILSDNKDYDIYDMGDHNPGSNLTLDRCLTKVGQQNWSYCGDELRFGRAQIRLPAFVDLVMELKQNTGEKLAVGIGKRNW